MGTPIDRESVMGALARPWFSQHGAIGNTLLHAGPCRVWHFSLTGEAAGGATRDASIEDVDTGTLTAAAITITSAVNWQANLAIPPEGLSFKNGLTYNCDGGSMLLAWSPE